MKITKIETVRLTSRPTLIWVRVHTDEGLIGLGESWFGCAAVEADIHERIAPALIGADPSRIEALSRAARPYVGFCGTGAEIRAASAIDVALWDIVGQAAGKPLYALLGGATRDDIRVYNTCAGPDYVSQSSDVRPENFGLIGQHADPRPPLRGPEGIHDSAGRARGGIAGDEHLVDEDLAVRLRRRRSRWRRNLA
jgi:galactonate dehydratase